MTLAPARVAGPLKPGMIAWPLAAVLLILGALTVRAQDSYWVREHGGCVHSAAPDSPYGQVRDCRLLDAETPLSPTVDARAYLLLDTDTGLVALKVDYRDIDMGRQYTAHAHELPADDLPGDVSTTERTRLATDIDTRGGVRTTPWTLSYGDG